MTERMLPPTSGSALLQFVSAALRSEGLGGSEVSEDDDDMVHVKNDSKLNKRPSLISKMSMHALGIHSDNDADTSEGSSDEDEEGDNESSPRPHPQREKSHYARSEQNDMSKSESAISFGSFRDKKSIAEKLRAAFGYSEVEDFLGEYSCWLARSVLLPGYMYLTTNHICFYANLPSSQDIVQKEGFFFKKSRTTKTFWRYWFVLKNDYLSYYNNQTDVYYPIKTIDLKHALSAEPSPSNEETFYIFTNNKKYTFKTDSTIQRADWVKAIQKSIFHAKMEGDKVKISIPVANVVDVEMNTMAFADAIQIKVIESDESFAVDEYYFAYFNDTPRTLAALKDQLRDYQSRHGKDSPHYQKIYDSTSPIATSPRKTSATTFTSKTEASHQPASSSGLSASLSLLQSPRRLLHPGSAKSRSRSSSPGRRSQPTSDTEDSEREKRSSLSFSIRGTTSWIQEHTPDFFSSDDNVPLTEKEQANFHKEFALPDSEGLSAVVSGYLLRVLPVYGRIYLSDNYICYKSRLYGTRTKVIVPLADISMVDQHKGTRFYFHGMSILTTTDEEIFFEFSTVEARNTILNTLRDRISPEAQEKRRKQRKRSLLETPSAELDDPMEARVMESLQLQEEPVHVEPWATQPLFKPSRPLHITCLTIGSRGDVQPYIALCKRLMQDGHTCRIATHAEYKDWIEGHGIEFGLVGGDPGELIELCVENGMFTVSFIREGLKRFRGWLDELMLTAWKACQNTDVLIESPSAMAGIHIAERLDIPYFRAFPFPWTRTRNFPHPFAVPEHKLGRGYNYMTYVMIEQVFWKGIAGQINKWRRDTLGLPPTSLEKMEAHRVPFLYSWSPHVLPAPIDWHAWIHVTGYWFLDNPDLNWTPPQDLLDFLKADPNNKPVYIGFGSMVVADPDGMTRTIIEAVVKSGVRAIISKGWSDRVTPYQEGQAPAVKKEAEEIVIPDSVYMIKSVPHDWLFPQLAGVVHHGGAGTVAAGLRAGVPTVIKPFFGDQYFWAQRVEEAGVGVWCHDLTVRKLTAALTTITTDEKMIKRAQMIGEKIRAEDGVGKAVQYFYHDLGEAKQRLSKMRKDKSEDTPLDFKMKEGEDDWWFVQKKGGSGTASGEGSESTVGLNVQAFSDEESLSVTPTPTDDRRGAFSGSGNTLQHTQSATNVGLSKEEPASHGLGHTQSEPAPDRREQILNSNDDSVEAIAARLEAMKPARQQSPPPFLNASSPQQQQQQQPAASFAEGENAGRGSHHQHSESMSSNKSSSGKRASIAARRVIDSIASKASHVTGYFSPSTTASTQQPCQPSPPPLSLSPTGANASAATSTEQQQQEQIEPQNDKESSASSTIRMQMPIFSTKNLR
ncbi:Sterol 3-beta-glucosyltransferase [Actinomortierella wolfii]|nr:Sterol 3-beta-glucosyltransferase [Actinomortierella wolfii]